MSVYKGSPTKKGYCWYFRTYYSSLDGIRKQYESKKYETKKEAQEQERLFLTKEQEISTTNLTMEELFNIFDNFKKENIKITSYQNYHKMYIHLKPLYKIKVADLSIEHYNKWKNNVNKDLSTAYKNNIYKFLRSVLNYAGKYLNINKSDLLNKMTNFTNPNELNKEMLFFEYDEFIKFINEENGLLWKTFFEMLYYCGTRLGEAKGLTWKDTDFKNIRINKSCFSKIKGVRYILTNPKTKGSIRTIPIPDVLIHDLKELYKQSQNIYEFNDDMFIFGGPFPLSDTTIQKRKNDLCKKANVKQIRIHDFRHSCASLLINSGASITLIAKYLGHSDIATTLNTYSHFYKNELNDIVRVINLKK